MGRPPKNTTVSSTNTSTETPINTPTNTQSVTQKAPRKFQSDDLITCRSVTQGSLYMPGPKSGILYQWSGYGDVSQVEYQDLYALKASKSKYLSTPLIIIEDDELLSDARWNDLKALYDKMYSSQDMTTLLKLPLANFKRALKEAPDGYRKALCIEVATQVENGTFDSINKIKAIDEICGTDLASTVF